jgi:predicted ATPase
MRNSRIARAARACAPTVFFAPPWREIYVNDAERPQTFADALGLSAHIRRAYLDGGFRLVELVKGSVADRLQQVLRCLEAPQHESERE